MTLSSRTLGFAAAGALLLLLSATPIPAQQAALGAGLLTPPLL